MVLIDGKNRWNEVMWLITDFLPYAQPGIKSFLLHISHNPQKIKGQTLRNGFARLEKTISHEFFGHDMCVYSQVSN